MSHGMRLNQLGGTQFDHLGLAPDTLQGAMELIDRELSADDSPVYSALAVTREVRRTMEEVLGLLNEALAAADR